MTDEEIFQDIITSNGVENASDENELSKIEYLEMYFNGLPRVACLTKFQNLKKFVVFGQDLKKMNPGFESCINLTELWICECKLESISGLSNCINLKKLYLYTNKISKIENLNNLNLDVLWINDNKIEAIEGIQHMKELRELNLAKNQIRSISDSLANLKRLENLNLSANLISSFEDIINLQSITTLKSLTFKDPQYGYCPVTVLCNYSIFMIYHFPELQRLDTVPVSQKTLKDLADATINKKKLWYNMRLNTLNREVKELQKKLEVVKNFQFEPYLMQKRALICKIKDLESYSDSMKLENAANDGIDDEYKKLYKNYQDKLNEINKKLQNFETYYQQSLNRIDQQKQIERNFTFIELENGGNIKFEYGKSDDVWCKSCHDLILSRFCSSDYLLKLVGGIKIHKIIRITNRLLLTKFEENLFQYVDENEYFSSKAILRKQMDYLMYCWRPQLGSQLDELYDIIKNGFKDVQNYRNVGLETAIPFSNSLSVSDNFRIESHKTHNAFNGTTSACPFKYGYTLLCKVYTNNFTKYEKADISPDNYKDKVGVTRQFTTLQNSKKQPGQTVSVTQEFLETQRNCDCKSKQMEWFLFNKHLAVPEYLIEFEYINKFSNELIFEVDLTSNSADTTLLKTSNSLNSLTDIQDSKYSKNSLIEKIKNDTSVAENYTELNLHNSELSKLNNSVFRNFRFLRKLIISFNSLTSLKDICYIYSLEYLDASYNNVDNLNGFKGFPKLTYLDLSNNLITDLTELLAILKQFLTNLNYLNINDNPFEKTEGFRVLCAYYLKNLQTLNNEKLSNFDLDIVNNKKLTYDMIVQHGFNLTSRPRSLKISFVADYFKNYKNKYYLNSNAFSTIEPNSSLYLNLSDQNWMLKVTVLCLDSQHLFKLNHINHLANLRWASFNNNYLIKIEGIDGCSKLEELSIENNYLRSLEGLDGLKNLRKLSLSNNEICYDNSRESITHVNFNSPRLSYLAINNNKIKSLKFVQRLPSLMELYANFNQISNLREIFHLKQMQSLVIIDLWCNPMCNDSKYRLFNIYHLKCLKSLDGYTIEASECLEAKEYFGGKLTCDFVAEKFPQIPFNELRSLDLPQCSIRFVDLGGAQLASQQFENLRSLNLENNCLTSFSGLVYLKQLKMLCLNYNKIESIFPKVKSNANSNANLATKLGNDQKQVFDLQPLMENLEVLHLGYNGITDLVSLQIGKLTSLKVLFLQGNEITKIEGLENLRNLRELVLDKNKIKFISETSFIGQTNRLVELHLEENRLKDLLNIQSIKCIEKLYLANNKISDVTDLDRMTELISMQELSLINNPIARKPHYRITVVDRLPRLRILDMVEISDDDRAKAELFFSEQYQQQLQQMQPQIIFNTISGYQASQAQLISNINPVQLDHQYISSPRLKPIMFMDKMLSNNNIINNTNNANVNLTNMNTTVINNLTLNANGASLNGNNNNNGKFKSKTTINNVTLNNYEKITKEIQAKQRNQY